MLHGFFLAKNLVNVLSPSPLRELGAVFSQLAVNPSTVTSTPATTDTDCRALHFSCTFYFSLHCPLRESNFTSGSYTTNCWHHPITGCVPSPLGTQLRLCARAHGASSLVLVPLWGLFLRFGTRTSSTRTVFTAANAGSISRDGVEIANQPPYADCLPDAPSPLAPRSIAN